MSVHWISRVWDFGPEDSSDRLVLLALADCANKDTGICWPSRETICQMTAMSISSVYRSILRLEKTGYITIDRKENRNQGWLYTLSSFKLTDEKTPSVKTPSVNLTESSVNLTGSIGQTDICNKEEPSLNRKEPNTLFPDIEKPKHKNGKATRIPEDFAVTDKHRAWAKENNLSSPDSHIDQFCDHFTAKAGRDATKLDWDAAFRNWIRNSPNFKGNGNGQRQYKTATDEKWDAARAFLEGIDESH